MMNGCRWIVVVLLLAVTEAGAQGVVFAEQMIEALNRGDVEAYGEWRAAAIADVEPGDEWRASYASLRERLGEIEVMDVSVEGDEAMLVLGTEDGEVAMTFTFEPSGERRIVTITMARDTMLDTTAHFDQLGVGPPRIHATMSADELSAALDTWLGELTNIDEFAGVVRLERHGELLYERAFGLANRSYDIPHTVDTSIRIGSITKNLIQVVIAQFIEDGLLDVDATLAELLPDSGVARADEITLRHLLAHQSGLGDFDFEAFKTHPNRLIRRPLDYAPFFIDAPLAFDPGTSQRYSNAGYILLGAIVERATGDRYEDVIHRQIFDPAGMTHSGFYPLDRVHPGVAAGYWRCEGPAGPWCANDTLIEVEGSPSGGSYSSAADLSRFEAALRSGELLDDDAWTHYAFTDEWPGEGRVDRRRWHASWAGGAEGVSSVVIGGSGWLIVVLANMGEPSGEIVGIALTEALRGG